jgi:hypothetical protein
MPEPFLEYAAPYEGKLRLSWMAPAFDTQAIFVAVAEDAEFTVNRRIFVLPLVAEAILTVGPGAWYTRVGAAQGKERGIVEWSGIHGPLHIQTDTPAIPTTSSASLPVLHHKPIVDGYRIHTGKAEPHVVVFEMGLVTDVGSRFSAGKTRWKWVVEKGAMGWTDCLGLQYPDTYAIRMSTFAGPTFPSSTPVLLGPGRTFPRVVCARTPFHRSLEDKQNARGDSILLQSRRTNPTMKFGSHAEYLRYQAALIRSGDDNARTVGPAHFSTAEEEAKVL